MKLKTITLIALAAMWIVACKSSKKTTGTTTNTTTSSTTNSTTATNTASASYNAPALPSRPYGGVYEPGDEELAAVKPQYADATLDQLKEGYAIYSRGACVNCHSVKSIFDIPKESCKDIIENMAGKAKLSDAQKTAVYRYVVSIKANQSR